MPRDLKYFDHDKCSWRLTLWTRIIHLRVMTTSCLWIYPSWDDYPPIILMHPNGYRAILELRITMRFPVLGLRYILNLVFH